MSGRHKRRFPIYLTAATILPVAVLTWLGLRTVEQDREIDRQRTRESLEVTAGRLALGIERQLRAVEQRLASGHEGVALAPAAFAEAESSLFESAERDEFLREDLRSAEDEYRRLAGSSQAAVRAAALVRLARVLRKRGDRTGALRAYSTLEELGALTVAGQPAGLLAIQGRARLWEEAGRSEMVAKEAMAGAQSLDSGRWDIDASTFAVYRGIFEKRGAGSVSPASAALVEGIRQLREDWRTGRLPDSGRRLFRTSQHVPLLAVWRNGPNGQRAWLATPEQLDGSFGWLWDRQQLSVSFIDLNGDAIVGQKRPGAVTLAPGETQLPFIISVAFLQSPQGADGLRRNLLAGILGFTMLLMLAAAYGLYRVVSRELMLAQQQSDFVSAVSHEFRTPLTSMRHLTDLLRSGSITSGERRAQYYDMLGQQAERLHRMVESLLSFGRLEAGGYILRREAVDVAELLNDLMSEYSNSFQHENRTITCDVEPRLPLIRGDRDALSRAVWNLLENASKYSAAGTPVRVFAKRTSNVIQVAVEDRGPGIPPAERELIFEKFVRGAEANRSGIRGVGIGLALVRRIAEAHGGSVALESAGARGSVFKLLLPVQTPE